MNPLLITGVGLACLAGAPFLLPKRRELQRARRIDADASTLFALLSSTESFQQFNPFCDEDESLKIEPFGPAHGVGAGFRFQGKQGGGSQTITDLEVDRSVGTTVDLGVFGSYRQVFELDPSGDQTEVRWRIETALQNPLARLFGLMMPGFLGKTWDRGLGNLERVALQGGR